MAINFPSKHFHDCIISLSRVAWAHETSLTMPLFTEVPVPSQENEWYCICVLGVSILPLSMIFIFDLELFRQQCGIFLYFIFIIFTFLIFTEEIGFSLPK